MQSPLILNLKWFRVVGDVVFAIGAIFYAIAVLDKVGIIKFSESSVEVEDEAAASEC